MRKLKKGVFEYIFLIVVLTILAIFVSFNLNKFYQNIMQTGSEKVGEAQKQILSNSEKRILLVKCGDKDPAPLINFLKNYGSVVLDTVATSDDDSYDVVVLYDCDLTSSEENILSWSDKVKIIGIGDVGDESFRRQLFRVEGYVVKTLPLEKLSKIIVPPGSLLSDKLTLDFIEPVTASIDYIDAKCDAINLANLDPWDPVNSQADVVSAACLTRNRLFFSYDINYALKDKQSINFIRDTFDFFLRS